MKLELKKGSRVHFIGIKGVGMTALAIILKQRGVIVSGSDTKEKFFTDRVLVKHKIAFKTKFDPQNIPDKVDAVICSTAYYFNHKALSQNPEVNFAIKQKLPILTYPEALGLLAKDYKVIAVAGSHGKSTTTALLGWVMEQCKKDPNVIVGTRVNQWDSNAKSGNSKYLVVEADEYREAFLNYRPYMTIITSIDYDHPDYFKTKSAYYSAFKKLVANTEKFLIVCGDDIKLKQLLAYGKERGLPTLSYGLLKANDVVLQETGVKHAQLFHASFRHPERSEGSGPRFLAPLGMTEGADFSIPFPGLPYVLNSGAVIAAAKFLKLPMQKVQKGIANFPGTARRLEIVKQTKNYTIIDDYAHHPTAIRLTLAGVKQFYPNQKIIVIFQPHMFSRTAALLKEFAKSFKAADAVGMMEVYPSARESTGPVGGKQLTAQTKLHHRNVIFLRDFSTAQKFLKENSNSGSVIVLMGAGNIRDIVN